jgi:multicomponent Na+:H+ antiporter subunit G
MSAVVEIARLALAAVMLAGGVGFMALATLGVARLPDPLSRLHAVTKAETAGLGLFLTGLVLCAPGWRLGLIAFGAWAALAISAASASHFVAGRALREPDEQ